MTDLNFRPICVAETKRPMRQTASPKTVAGPLKLRPEVAYTPWEDRAKEVLVAEMRKQQVTYKLLARRLEPFGIEETPDQLNRKVNRKRFSAAFLLACLAAMGAVAIEVPAQVRAPKFSK